MSESAASNDVSARKAVLQALAGDMRLAELGLRVGVLGGFVHLGGIVPAADLRRLAEVVAARVSGVRGVVNRIQAPGAPSPARTIHVRRSKGLRGPR